MQLLEKQSDKIDELLAIERELSRVRLEIEQMEGRLAATRLSGRDVDGPSDRQRENDIYSTRETFLEPARGDRMVRGKAGRDVFFEDTTVFLIANTFVILAWVLVGCIVWFMFRAWRRRVR